MNVIIVGWVLAVAGAILFLWSLILSLRVDPTRLIPYWQSPAVIAHRSIALRSIGAGRLILDAIALKACLGYWSIGIVLVALLPALIIIPLDNRRIALRNLPR